MKKFLSCTLCFLLLFALCVRLGVSAQELPRTSEVPFEEMYAVFKEYEGLNIEQLADVLDEADILDGQIPYRGSSFVHASGGNALLGNIGEYSGIIEITWTSYSFPIECIRSVAPGMTREKVEQHLFSGGIPLWKELSCGESDDALRDAFLLTSRGELCGSPVRIELHFFFTADTLTAIRLSVCSEAAQEGGSPA